MFHVPRINKIMSHFQMFVALLESMDNEDLPRALPDLERLYVDYESVIGARGTMYTSAIMRRLLSEKIVRVATGGLIYTRRHMQELGADVDGLTRRQRCHLLAITRDKKYRYNQHP